ncbi:MAG: hypothetical protein IJH94_08065 [Clostridia bacterium]|nr:hypothetical protein [Clostridia bacterium]
MYTDNITIRKRENYMKKIAAVLCGTLLFGSCMLSAAAYSQQDIYTAADSSLDWLINKASPLKTPESATSDNSVIALSRMNKSFDYNKYLSFTQSRNPSTDKDGQRLIMTETACGSAVSDSFVRLYTYDHMRDNADDLAGAIITLDSGGYTVKDDGISIEYMVMELLSMQQSDGSFDGNVYITARAVIALSPHRGIRYDVTGANDNESYTYSTEAAIANAVSYLSDAKGQDHSYGTFTNTAYVIMALDSVGINPETDSRFASGEASPISFLMTHQSPDGSFNSSEDDTAIAACALVSHVRALQGKSPFFSFKSGDTVTAPAKNAAASAGDTAPKTDAVPKPNKTEPPVIKLTPLPTKAPEHSELDEEEYGPFAPVGPVKPDTTKKTDRNGESTEEDDTPRSNAPGIALTVIAVVLILIGGAMLFMYIKYPEKMKAVTAYIKKNILKPDDGGTAQADTGKAETEAPEELYDSEPAVSTEELYDPDFVKKLVPVDELDDTLGELVSDTGTDNEH